MGRHKKQAFDVGDIIQNKKPYDGEEELIITKVDANRKEYIVRSFQDGGELGWTAAMGFGELDAKNHIKVA